MPERSKGFAGAGSCFCFSLTCIRYREASDRFQPNLLQSKMGSDPKILLSLFPPGTASASAGISVLSDSCNVGSATIESTGSTVSCVPGEHACILRYAGHERHQQAAVAARRVDEWTRLDELLVPLRRRRRCERAQAFFSEHPDQSSCPQAQADAIVQSAWKCLPVGCATHDTHSACRVRVRPTNVCSASRFASMRPFVCMIMVFRTGICSHTQAPRSRSLCAHPDAHRGTPGALFFSPGMWRQLRRGSFAKHPDEAD
jgi:hypothetical protein